MRLKGIALFLMGAGLSALAQKNPTFVPVPAEVSDVINVSEPKSIGLGFYINTLVPTSEPFQSHINGSQNFRFQNATGAGAEFTYTFSTQIEAGLDIGYEQYSSRAQTGSGTILEFQKIKYWQVPILGIFRFKFMNEDISPEVEAGAGYGYGKIKIGSTNLGAIPVEDTLTSYRGYLAAGAGFAWNEDSSIHASLGYGIYKFEDKNYTNTLISVSQSSASGIFIKTVMRYKF
jgi:opacity protein-like surface antigen